MRPLLTVFENSPDRGQGHARDMRVRWALEEVGQDYDIRTVSFQQMKEPSHRRLQPFGQIPTLETGTVSLFETGAILLHIASEHAGLLPEDDRGRAKALSWFFAALNTIEPPIVEREAAGYTMRDRPWFGELLALLDEKVDLRLRDLSDALADRDWLCGHFSLADIMMVTVLRRLEGSSLIEKHASLCAYMERGKSRPAYQRAFDAQHALYRGR
ncbi:glutathione S-transferase family protein [Nitratireductor sp.]|uniref:glutathione S-transferase family protein n=1 Tax=Nitratireductor sp. TaxID=1872084 RepID=UPI0025D1D68C|nr:glutathione S-transferase family protein [Nitratireductor sp.]